MLINCNQQMAQVQFEKNNLTDRNTQGVIQRPLTFVVSQTKDKLNQRYTIHVPQFQHQFSNERSTLIQKQPENRNSPLEPQSFAQQIQSMFTNSFVEIITFSLLTAALVWPSDISLIFAIGSQILLGMVPLLVTQNQVKRNRIYQFVFICLIGLSVFISSYKLYRMYHHNHKLESMKEPSFVYDAIVLLLLASGWWVNQEVKANIEFGYITFFANKHFGSMTSQFRFLFCFTSLVEGILYPDQFALLALIFIGLLVTLNFMPKQYNTDQFQLQGKDNRRFWFNIVFKISLFYQICIMLIHSAQLIFQEIEQSESGMDLGVWVYKSQQGVSKTQASLIIFILFFATLSYKAEQLRPLDENINDQNQIGAGWSVLLRYLMLVSTVLLAYVYNSMPGFYHLLWAMICFLWPQMFFYNINCFVYLPIMVWEFAQVYQTCFQECQISGIRFNWQTIELALLYAYFLLVFMLVPGRVATKNYLRLHQKQEITQAFIQGKIMDPNASLLWRILYLLSLKLHNPVLILIWYFGSQQFNFFRLGFMLFFILFGAFDNFYLRFSFLMPAFVSFFICGQYLWSIQFDKWESMIMYNRKVDFFYLLEEWHEPVPEDRHWMRAPSFLMWLLYLLVFCLFSIASIFRNQAQTDIYAQECSSQILDQWPTLTKFFKALYRFFFSFLLLSVVIFSLTSLLSQPQNLTNLIYLILFLSLFGKMCQTSLDSSSSQIALRYADRITYYSALVLFIYISYFLTTFEFKKSFQAYFDEINENSPYYVLFMTLLGFQQDEKQVKQAISLYTIYFLIGQFLVWSNRSNRGQAGLRDLFQWERALRSESDLKKVHTHFYVDSSYTVFRLFFAWPLLDFVATYFHLFANGLIVYFALTAQLSLYFYILLVFLTYFYTSYAWQGFKINRLIGSCEGFDMSQAQKASSRYNLESSNLILRLRQRIWNWQYTLTLSFIFLSYMCEFIITVIEMKETHDLSEKFVKKFENAQFYLFWVGCIFSNVKHGFDLIGVSAKYYIIAVLLLEKQAQNWLYSRQGLNETMIERFTKIQCLKKLEKEGRKWGIEFDTKKDINPQMHPNNNTQDLTLTRSGLHVHLLEEKTVIRSPQDLIKTQLRISSFKKTREDEEKLLKPFPMELFENTLAFTWSEVKREFRSHNEEAPPAYLNGSLFPALKRMSRKNRRTIEALQESLSLMNKDELTDFEERIKVLFDLDFDLSSKFQSIKVQVDQKDVVMFFRVKTLVLNQLVKHNKIDQRHIPFLNYEVARSKKTAFEQQVWGLFYENVAKYHKQAYLDLVQAKVVDNIQKHFEQSQGLKKVQVVTKASSKFWFGLDSDTSFYYPLSNDKYLAIPFYLEQEQHQNYLKKLEQLQFDQDLENRKQELQKILSRKFQYAAKRRQRVLFEQSWLLILLLAIVWKANIVSLMYLILVCIYMFAKDKSWAIRHLTKAVAVCFVLQYACYLLNLTSYSSPAAIPGGVYPNNDDQVGEYFVPVLFKYPNVRAEQYAFWYTFAAGQQEVSQLWFDIILLMFAHVYFKIYLNPTLAPNILKFELAHETKQASSEWREKLDQYHNLMQEKYPESSVLERLKDLKEQNQHFTHNRSSKLIIYTCSHIFIMVAVLLIALFQRSYVSLFYIILLSFCLVQSVDVLKQNSWQQENQQRQQELLRLRLALEFQKGLLQRSMPRFSDILKRPQSVIDHYLLKPRSKGHQFKWSQINLICNWMQTYALLDILIQTIYQIPYIRFNSQQADIIGLRKSFTVYDFNYTDYLSMSQKAPEPDYQNIQHQFYSCITLFLISIQARIFDSCGYQNFISKKGDGLDLLSHLTYIKARVISYRLNNQKLRKILAIQKTEKQIFDCVTRVKENVVLFQKSQQRQMLEEWFRQVGAYLPPILQMKTQPILVQPKAIVQKKATLELRIGARKYDYDGDSANWEWLPEPQRFTELIPKEKEVKNAYKRLAQVIESEKKRREQRLQDLVKYTFSKMLPFRAKIYIQLMSWSNSYIFIWRASDMLDIYQEVREGREVSGVDLVRIIRKDLLAFIKRNPNNSEVEPTLQDLQQTQNFCRWTHIIGCIFDSLMCLVVSNTIWISYICMVSQMYFNPGLLTLIYPLAVFGYAMLEETRPHRIFWRIMLYYSLLLLIVQYAMNFSSIFGAVSSWYDVYYDGILKLGLKQEGSEFELVFWLLPNILTILSILCHEIVEQLIGLYDQSERDIEKIDEAIDRITCVNIIDKENFDFLKYADSQQSQQFEEEGVEDADQPNFDQILGLRDKSIVEQQQNDPQIIINSPTTQKRVTFVEDYSPQFKKIMSQDRKKEQLQLRKSQSHGLRKSVNQYSQDQAIKNYLSNQGSQKQLLVPLSSMQLSSNGSRSKRIAALMGPYISDQLKTQTKHKRTESTALEILGNLTADYKEIVREKTNYRKARISDKRPIFKPVFMQQTSQTNQTPSVSSALQQQQQDQDDNYFKLDGNIDEQVSEENRSDSDLASSESSQLAPSQTSLGQQTRRTTVKVNRQSILSQRDDELTGFSGFLYCSLFPRIQEQKPGRDYYGILTFNLLCLCIYLLIYYSEFSTSGLYQDSGIFQTEEVILLFYLLFVLVAERFVARTENREIEAYKQELHDKVKSQISAEELFQTPLHQQDQTSDNNFESLVIKHLKFQHLHENTQLLKVLGKEIQIQLNQRKSQKVTKQQWSKLVLHWFQLILVHLFVFWFLPIQTNYLMYGSPYCQDIYGCKDFAQNPKLQMFYLLYLLYFFFSALQIAHGLPSFRRGSSTMLLEGSDIFEPEEDIGNAVHTIFISIPLLAEFRCLLDFCMTKTTLDAFQTFQLFQYHSDFYLAKVQNRWYNYKPLGSEPTLTSKIIGYTMTLAIVLTALILPFWLFSATTTQLNPVISARLAVSLQVNFTTASPLDHAILQPQTQDFQLYESSDLMVYNYTADMFRKRRFDQIPESKFFEPEQLQDIVASRSSDNNWALSDAKRLKLHQYACEAMLYQSDQIEGCNQTEVQHYNISIGFIAQTFFVREEPDLRKVAKSAQIKVIDLAKLNDQEAMQDFASIVGQQCEPGSEKRVVLRDMMIPKFLAGQSDEAQPLLFETSQSSEEALEDLVLVYKCHDQWALETLAGQKVTITVFSQKIKISFLAEYSIFTLYITVIFAYIKIREMLVWHSSRGFIHECTQPDPILRLCESIYLSRCRGNLRAEDENFRLLADIIRSPELLHQLTGSRLKRGQDQKPIEAPSDKEHEAHLVPKAYY